jgi:hypothetical protein
MRKLIYLVILVFIVIEASKHPLFSDLISDIEQEVLDKASSTVGKTNNEKIKTELSLLKNTLSSIESAYIVNNIKTMAEAEAFKQTYCDSKSQLSHSVLTPMAFEQTCNILIQYIK